MDKEFDEILEKTLETAKKIVVRYDRSGEIIFHYNEDEKDKLHELLKQHDCYNFTSGSDGFVQMTITEPGWRLCKYCGNLHKTNDVEILCQECRQTFGHTYYSEL